MIAVVAFAVVQGASLTRWIEARTVGAELLIGLDTDHVTSVGTDFNLAAFDRRLDRIGQVSAIVPRTMVVFDNDLKEPTDPYNGMRRAAKILLLATSLDDDQWKIATRDGVSLKDLRPDQAPILESILPDPFAVDRGAVSKAGELGPGSTHSVLSDDDRARVRVRLERSLVVSAPIEGQKLIANINAWQDLGEAGANVVARDTRADNVGLKSFGALRRVIVPNAPKRNDLDLTSREFARVVSVPPNPTVARLLQSIELKVGWQLRADVRIRDLKLTVRGNSAPARDLLLSLARMTCGAFRRVENVYILASDLVGQGARQLKFAAHDAEIRTRVSELEASSRERIARKDRLDLIEFDPGDARSPNAEQRKWVDAFPPGAPTTLKASDLPNAVRTLIEHENTQDPVNRMSADGVGLRTEISAHWILGDGTKIAGDAAILGLLSQFVPEHPFPSAQPPIDAPENLLAVLQIRDVSDVEPALALASKYGIKRIAIDSRDRSLIQRFVDAASARGIDASIAIRPFALAVPRESLDRTILGQTTADAIDRIRTTPEWRKYHARPGISPVRGAALPPTANGINAVRSEIASLTHLKSSGTLWLDVTPPGYEGKRLNGTSWLQPWWLELRNGGYTDQQRRMFFAETGIDPIDIPPPSLIQNIRFDIPFFGDEAIKFAQTAWPKWLADIHRRSLDRLLRAANLNVPNFLQIPSDILDDVDQQQERFALFPPGSPPSIDDQRAQRLTGFTITQANIAASIPRIRSGADLTILDLGAIDLKSAEAWLARAFKPKRRP